MGAPWIGVTAVCLLVGGCSSGGSGTGSPSSGPSSEPSSASAELVLQVRATGGLPGPTSWGPRVPLVSVYADGRVISEGPEPAISPAPALPDVQVQHISAADVGRLRDDAVAAGVAQTGDLGRPPIADAMTTVFTLVDGSGRHVREVYALGADSTGAAGLSPGQTAARAKLQRLLDELNTEAQSGNDQPYEASGVAVVVRPWTQSGNGNQQPAKNWPGPALPGQPVGTQPGETCVRASGEAAHSLLAAAGDASQGTPWVTADGRRWAARFRPLLPGETGCADVTG
jgi:hypothetical protein